jgi:hypothetical protein
MGLSEHEQRLLEELEKDLYESDQGFANRVKKQDPERKSSGRLILGVLSMVAGLGMLIFAVSLQVAFFGIAAFAVMFIGVILISSNLRLPNLPSGSGGASGNFFEDRWNKRFGE